MSFEFFIDQDIEPTLPIGDLPTPISSMPINATNNASSWLESLNVVIPGLGSAFSTVWNFVGGLFGGGKTPTLDWEEYAPIASQAAVAVAQEFRAKGIYDKLSDGSFHRAAINFVSTHNQGREHERAGIIADMNADPTVQGDLFRSLSYQLSGVSRDPNDVTGIQWRVNQWMQDLVVPEMKRVQSGGALPSSVKLPEDSKSLLTVGVIAAGIIGLFFVFKSK
jgi:hypothetical protein